MTSKKELNNEEQNQVTGGTNRLPNEAEGNKSIVIYSPSRDLCHVIVGVRFKVYKKIDVRNFEFITLATFEGKNEQDEYYAIGDDGITYIAKYDFSNPECVYVFASINRSC